MRCSCTALQHMLIRSTVPLYYFLVASSTIAARFNYVNYGCQCAAKVLLCSICWYAVPLFCIGSL
jgi:hypothetical protein